MRSARLPDPGDDPWQVVEVCPCHSHHGIPQPTKPVLAPLLCHERVRATIAVLDLAVELDHNAGSLDDEVDPGDEVPGLVGDDHLRFERDAGDRQREPQPRLPHGFRAAVHVGQHRADPAGSRPAVHRPCGLDHDHLPVHGGVSGHDPGGSPTLQAVLDQSDRGRHLTVNRRVTAVEDRRGHRLVRARSHRAQRWTDDEPLRQHLPDHRPHEVSPRQVGAPEGYAHRSQRAVAGELRVGIEQQADTRQTKVRSLGGEGLPCPPHGIHAPGQVVTCSSLDQSDEPPLAIPGARRLLCGEEAPLRLGSGCELRVHGTDDEAGVPTAGSP